ncbi:CELL DIVISION PROTEIN KINASE [Salix purpurea]|uniref:CELL DIVISION PROTEIN KINASE n=1 Tax=Salix purpurea TaxID=77065 RepID=A0A9Q0ZVD8_SALPP|nr:CELL DIVISION PROTEIN KINASE [Salix purpurea]
MGCVLSMYNARRLQSRGGPSDHGRSSDEQTVTDADNAEVRVKRDKTATMNTTSTTKQRRKATRDTGDFQVKDVQGKPERRGPPPEASLRCQQGWPSWLMAVAGDAVGDWTPRRANTFEKLDKIGQGTYSNVYKARDLITGKIVALKKVRFDDLEPESVKFMAREILVLRRLDHPNVLKLEGLVTSRMSCSLYLVFEYMEHDLAGLVARQGVKFTEPQLDFNFWRLSGKVNVNANLHLLAGKPIMPGRTEVEQLHMIFKLCGSPSEEYWKKSKLPNATLFKPQQPYKRCIAETFKDFPASSLPLIETLLSIDPDDRVTATASLNSEFFTTKPYACEPSSLPKYPPSKELDVKLRDEEARRQRGPAGKANAGDGARRVKIRDRPARAIPAPEANAENPASLDRWRAMTQANAKSRSEKFPPPHQDAEVGHPKEASHKGGPVSFGPSEPSYSSSVFDSKSSSIKNAGAIGGPSRRTKINKEDLQMAQSQKSIRPFNPSSVGLSMNQLFKGKSVALGNQSVTGQVRIALRISSSYRAYLRAGSSGKQCNHAGNSKVGASNF